MKRILGIGNAIVDVIIFIDDEKLLERFSLPKGSMHLIDNVCSEVMRKETEHFHSFFASGGSAANTIHGLSMLGAETGFIGSIGNDKNGCFFENDLKSAGVKTFLKRSNTPTGVAIAFVTPDSERTFATYLGAAIELYPDDLTPDKFQNFDILYLEGYLINNFPFLLRACSLAKSMNMKIALDLASYNVVADRINSFREIVDNYIDILFANSDESRTFTGLEPEKALELLSEKCEIIVIKTGAEGSLVKRGNETYKIRPYPALCLDTTGAGDLYASGFLYGLAQDKPLITCGQYGSYLASRVIEDSGARIVPAKWPEIKKAISEI
ncbi:MAG TPA: adenosine kinase [Bacteroidales bacterium]|nr:adenosine kinase [Bacteroidales bacterium]HCI55947.1 adenosine kinase [Bacteroidales bacterium]HOU96305.1 adenosine kinase [Bacteroidales bacterium]HQG36685.1 adenosine kinase [Bacteroidales bacterium]HQG52172.1 adenosine kinase [Bacteroidales bacterium]